MFKTKFEISFFSAKTDGGTHPHTKNILNRNPSNKKGGKKGSFDFKVGPGYFSPREMNTFYGHAGFETNVGGCTD